MVQSYLVRVIVFDEQYYRYDYYIRWRCANFACESSKASYYYYSRTTSAKMWVVIYGGGELLLPVPGSTWDQVFIPGIIHCRIRKSAGMILLCNYCPAYFYSSRQSPLLLLCELFQCFFSGTGSLFSRGLVPACAFSI